jgi:GDP-mannose 6-dehydrogenase
MKIAIYGMGYVGLTAAACLAKLGNTVLGIDVNDSKVAQVNAAISPIKEPGLDELLRLAVEQKRLSARREVTGNLAGFDMAIVCVGTPSLADGSLNLGHIAEVSRQIAAAVDTDRSDPLTVVYRSTIRPGTMEMLVQPIFRATLGDRLDAVELIYNPEFLRESYAIKDFFDPPKVVVGTVDGRPSPKMDALQQGIDAPVFHTRYREAEITKFVDNSFHALKVAFANELGRLCVQLGVDAQVTHRIFISDTKLNISPQYLRPGGAFGGSCLPKDVRAMQHLSAEVGANTHVIDALMRSNAAHKHFLFQHCTMGLGPRARLLMLGLAFKADSDDLRESPNLDLARKLMQAGHELSIYDPALEPERLVGQNLGYAYANLPELGDLLVDRATVERGGYDRVIDVNGWSGRLNLSGAPVVNISVLA